MDSNITQIAKYVHNLEEELYDRDGNGTQWQQELTTLHRMIETLMGLRPQEKEKGKRAFLAATEYKVRRCRDCILSRTGMKN